MKALPWHYAAQHHRLIPPHLAPQRVRRLTRRALTPPLVFLPSVGMAAFNPGLAKLSWGAVALALV